MASSYLTVGSGDRHVLALHGWFGSARGWGSLPDYLDGSAFTYVFPDLRGYGGRRDVTGAGNFDIHRRPNPHLVFGHGPHFCLGAHLARTQMAALLREVLARTSTLRYAGEPSFLQSNFQRGVKRLPIAWSAA